METLLKIDKLNKNYEKFSLKDVSFEVKAGQIMGFIGRNGAGKTTTLKSILNLVHYDSGSIYAFGKNMFDNELENKQRIGFALSEINYYPNKTIRQLMNVTKHFYTNFDVDKFNNVCKLFNLDIDKKIDELSSGMKVKFSVAVALSHNAELLILDEPTSGLDPVSRNEVLDIFKQIVKDEKRGILFSTHITSDLEKCASDITYIHDGKIIYTGKKQDFIDTYFYVKDSKKDTSLLNEYISFKKENDYIEGLILASKKEIFNKKDIILEKPTLEEIMIFLERDNSNESFDL